MTLADTRDVVVVRIVVPVDVAVVQVDVVVVASAVRRRRPGVVQRPPLTALHLHYSSKPPSRARRLHRATPMMRPGTKPDSGRCQPHPQLACFVSAVTETPIRHPCMA